MTTNNSVNSPLSGTTGSGNFVGSTSPSITTGINDTNSNTWITQAATASAVNGINITNNSTGNAPIIQAEGTDTNITLQIKGKGTGAPALLGTSTNDSASAGYVGQIISSSVTTGSGVTLTTATAANVTSISLTAGDWDVHGNVFIANTLSSSLGLGFGWISTTSATEPDKSLLSGLDMTGSAGINALAATVPYVRISISSTTTVYLSTIATFNTGTTTASGNIFARRAR